MFVYGHDVGEPFRVQFGNEVLPDEARHAGDDDRPLTRYVPTHHSNHFEIFAKRAMLLTFSDAGTTFSRCAAARLMQRAR